MATVRNIEVIFDIFDTDVVCTEVISCSQIYDKPKIRNNTNNVYLKFLRAIEIYKTDHRVIVIVSCNHFRTK
jgi:hypothetical protein